MSDRYDDRDRRDAREGSRDGTPTDDPAAIDCEEAVRRLAAYLDRELDPAKSDEVEEHLERCRSCYSRAEFERRLKERIRRDLRVGEVPPEFEERVRTLLRDLPERS